MMHLGDSGETKQRDKSQIRTDKNRTEEHTKILQQKSREGKENFHKDQMHIRSTLPHI